MTIKIEDGGYLLAMAGEINQLVHGKLDVRKGIIMAAIEDGLRTRLKELREYRQSKKNEK